MNVKKAREAELNHQAAVLAGGLFRGDIVTLPPGLELPPERNYTVDRETVFAALVAAAMEE